MSPCMASASQRTQKSPACRCREGEIVSVCFVRYVCLCTSLGESLSLCVLCIVKHYVERDTERERERERERETPAESNWG